MFTYNLNPFKIAFVLLSNASAIVYCLWVWPYILGHTSFNHTAVTWLYSNLLKASVGGLIHLFNGRHTSLRANP